MPSIPSPLACFVLCFASTTMAAEVARPVPPMRQENLARLTTLGFTVAPGLPTARSDKPVRLRPLSEVATRLQTLAAVYFWAGVPERMVKDHVLEGAMLHGRLMDQAMNDDIEILDLTRAEAARKHGNTVGWRLENMWALAWVLGFERAPSLDGQIDDDTRRALLEFVRFPKELPAALLKRAKPRSVEEVDRMEDLFYCAHNAVRTAQLGDKTAVPAGFHPVRDGGAIHERRHSLTWVLSPGVEWDETDLST
jgi:hypothetical protein